MEPSDRYNRIILNAKTRTRSPKLHLAREVNALRFILNKESLLADDKTIKDPLIRHQISEWVSFWQFGFTYVTGTCRLENRICKNPDTFDSKTGEGAAICYAPAVQRRSLPLKTNTPQDEANSFYISERNGQTP